VVHQDCVSLDVDTSLSSSDELEEDTEGRSSETQEVIESPSPAVVFIPDDSRPSSAGSPVRRATPTLPFGRLVPGHSSKASLASPEEMSLGEVHPKFGTSV
jgi:hypothetical protein